MNDQEKSTKIRTIKLDFDLIEVHHNKRLSKKPYLVRIFNYNSDEPSEIRLEECQVKNLYSILKQEKLL